MSILRRLNKRIIRWLAICLAEHEKELRYIPATVQPSSLLMAESIIESSTGDPADIVIGADCVIRGRLVAYGVHGRLVIGEACYIGSRTEIWAMESIQIGNRVLISHNVNIQDNSGHSRNPQERHEHYKEIITSGHPRTRENIPGIVCAPIVIEDDVWINFGVTILKGVRIGARSIIAAGAIVTKDVPPDTLYRCEINPILTPLANIS